MFEGFPPNGVEAFFDGLRLGQFRQPRSLG